ncbi:LOW QUALITY PROTEIN: hypothetical protein CRUP_027530, partial [Coryphaenoides rupestris]
MFSSVTAYKNQHYHELKRTCLKDKTLFEDPEFPTTNKSLFFRKPPPGRVEWKRPGEISEEPHLFVEGISAHDLHQGLVIPDSDEQEWDHKRPEKYAGIFHFQFWIFGEWLDVVVDDRLPTINGELIYCHSKPNNEYWSALLEKAYAKLSGCYESLEGGNTGDAVVDFSGAVAETFDLEAEAFYKDKEKEEHLFEDLLKVFERGGLISCSIKIELKMANGLGHAYSVTAVKRVRLGHGLIAYFKNETIPMIRMRNPWGKTEWSGAWSDSSDEWKTVGDMERGDVLSPKTGVRHSPDADGLPSHQHLVGERPQDWCEVMHRGSWTKEGEPLRNRCGGCSNHTSTFLQKPTGRDMKIHRQIGQGENLYIGFSVFH